MEQDPGSVPPRDQGSGLILARSALMAALCDLLPLPILDEVLLGRAHRHLVASLLSLHGHPTPLEAVRPLYGGRGCLEGACGFLLWLPFKLVVKALKKLLRTVLFVLAIRSAALAMGEALLLGRAVERCLLDGRLPPTPPDPARPAGPGHPAWEASARLRRAFAVAFKSSDLRLLRQLLAGVLRGVAGLPRLARDVVRRVFRRRPEAEVPDVAQDMAALPQQEQAQVEDIAQRMVKVLAEPQLQGFLADFEARFDEAWAAAEPPSNGGEELEDRLGGAQPVHRL